MVIFNDLRIDEAKEKLYVECFVEDLPAYDNMYIKSIYVYHYSNASTVDGAPIRMNRAIQIYNNSNDDTTVRTVSARLLQSQLQSISNFGTTSLAGELFFVMVTCDGELGDTSEYASDAAETVDIGITMDWGRLYEYGMKYITGFNGNPCNFPQGYENFIMLWFGLKLALEIKDYVQIINLWNKFQRLSMYGTNVSSTGCNCG